MKKWKLAWIFVAGLLLMNVASASDWPMYGHDNNRTSSSSEGTPPITNSSSWNYTTSTNFFAIDDTAVYIQNESGNTFNKLDVDTGEVIWSKGISLTNPVIFINGSNVVIMDIDNLYVLARSDGSTICSNTSANGSRYAVIGDNRIYVNGHNLKSMINAYNLSDCSKEWSYYAGSGQAYTFPAYYNEVVYYGAGNGTFALNANTGALVWRTNEHAYCAGNGMGSPVIYGTMIFMHRLSGDANCFGLTDRKRVVALNLADGTEAWSKTSANYANGGTLILPAVYNDNVYIRTRYKIYTFNASNGSVITEWNICDGNSDVADAPLAGPIVVNNTLIVGRSDGWVGGVVPCRSVFAYNLSDNSEIWKYYLGSYPSMLSAVDDKVYITSSGGFRVIGPAGADTTPPASISNLMEIEWNTTWILWNWTNPADADFNHTEVWINGTFYVNVSTPSYQYNATGLTPSTTYMISTRTTDHTGNVNATWINDTATTSCLESWVASYVYTYSTYICNGDTGYYERTATETKIYTDTNSCGTPWFLPLDIGTQALSLQVDGTCGGGGGGVGGGLPPVNLPGELPKICEPMSTRACLGPNFCKGEETCSADGTRWGQCICLPKECRPGTIKDCIGPGLCKGQMICTAEGEWGPCICIEEKCKPGEKRPCLGPNDCPGEQVCIDGVWGPCICLPEEELFPAPLFPWFLIVLMGVISTLTIYTWRSE